MTIGVVQQPKQNILKTLQTLAQPLPGESPAQAEQRQVAYSNMTAMLLAQALRDRPVGLLALLERLEAHAFESPDGTAGLESLTLSLLNTELTNHYGGVLTKLWERGDAYCADAGACVVGTDGINSCLVQPSQIPRVRAELGGSLSLYGNAQNINVQPLAAASIQNLTNPFALPPDGIPPGRMEQCVRRTPQYRQIQLRFL